MQCARAPSRSRRTQLTITSKRRRDKSGLGADFRDELGDPLDERGLVMAVELGPRRERRWIGHAVDKDLAEQVIDLVLIGAGLQAMHHLVDRVAVAVPRLNADVHAALHEAAQVRDREAALVVVELFIGHRRQHRVHEHRERNVRLVRIARVVAHFDRADRDRFVDLDRCEAGAIGIVHRLDQVIDELLDLRRRELFAGEVPSGLAKNRMSELGDLADGHFANCTALPRDAESRAR